MIVRSWCYFARSVAKNRPYTIGGESDGSSLLCVFHDTGELIGWYMERQLANLKSELKYLGRINKFA